MANLLSTTVNGQLNTGNVIDLGYTVNGSIATTAFRGINFHSFGDLSYYIGKPAGSWTQPLHIHFYTGIWLRSHHSYGGTRFYNIATGSQLMSVGDAGDAINVYTKITSSISSGTVLSHASMDDAIGWNSSYGTYIGSTVGGTYYIYGNGRFYDNGTIRTLIHSGNIGSQNVGSVQGYSAYSLIEGARGTHSGSDFPNGTLVTTDIPAQEWAGASFVMEVSGKSYSSLSPFKLIMQGYLYADTVINVSAMSYGSYFPAPVKVMNLNGNLAFWWPRGSYWNSFEVHVRDAGGSGWNRVTGIDDSVDPAEATKKVSCTPIQVIHTNNIGSQSVNYATSAGSATTATTAGSLTSMNISQFTNNSGYITSVGNITRLWAESHPNDYYVRANWTGSYWQLTSNHPSPVQVGYADNAGSATTAGALTSMNISQFSNNSGYITSSASITGNAASATFARRIAGPERIGFNVGGDPGMFYPIAISTGAGSTDSQYSEFIIERGGYEDPGYTGIAFSTFNARFTYKPSGWGYGAVYFNLEQLTQTATMLGDYLDQYQSSQAIIWLRGATRYNIYSVYGGIGLIFTNESGTSYSMAYGTYDPISTPREKATTAKYYDSTVRYAGTIYTGSNAVIHAGNIGSQSVSYATTAGSLSSMNISQFTNNSGYITGYTETDTLASVTGRGATTASQVSFTKTDDHAISVGTIRGRAVGSQTGEFIQLYERVNIGGPNGWGAANTSAPTYGLSVFGGATIGYGNSGGLAVTGTLSATNFSGSSSGTNTGDQTNISGNAATATTASNLAADTSTRFKILTFTGVGGDSGNGAMPDSYAIYQQGGSWTHPYPDLCIGYHTGIKIGANSGYNGTRFYNDSNWATEIFSVGNGDNHVRVLNNLYVTGTVTGSNLSGTNTGDQTNISGNAATATYATSAGSATNATNSDNAGHLRTAYDGAVYSNPQQYFNNTIGLKAAMTGAWTVWSDTLWINGYSGGDVLQMCALHTMRNGSPRMAISVQASTATSYGTFYEVITGYNIASQSVSNADTVDGFHAAVAGTANTIPTRNASGYLIPENWIQLNGIYGLYSPTNNAHLRPNDGSYGSWLVTGSRNGWRGLEFDSGSNGNVSLMVSVASNTTGFHNNNYGWQFYWEGGTLYCFKNNYGAGTQATVLDSVNFTSYAWPLEGSWKPASLSGSTRLRGATSPDGGEFGLAYSSGQIHPYADGFFYQNEGAYRVIDTNSVGSYAPTLTGGGASGSWGISVTGSAGGVSWGNVSSKPSRWLNATNLIDSNEPDATTESGFWQSYLGSGNPTGTWFNYVNVRHSNPANAHGYQIGMSYYDNNLWFRSYQGSGTYQTWSRALGTNTDPYPSNMNQYVRTTDDVTHNSTTSPLFLVNGHSDNTKGYRIHNTSGSSVSAMFTNSSNQLVIAAGAVDQINLNKKVYVNGVALGVNIAPSATAGRIDASNDIVAFSSSDERLKQNITPIANALDKVKSLTGVEFDWKPEYKEAHGHEGHDTGIIAQQVLSVMPTAVRTNDTGYLAVRYEKLIGLLIEGMKEQQSQIEELKAKLDGLTK